MKVDRALILAAGFGTRMGEIGKTLPKVLWPVLNMSLLELQVLYLKKMGIENIYINLHFFADEILKYSKKKEIFNDVTFLKEKEILGVGGAIHNLAFQPEINYKGNLLIINADQFCFFDKKLWESAYNNLKDATCSLFATIVHRKHRYNEIILSDDNNLIAIEKPNDKVEEHLTYGGFGFIDLQKIEKKAGASHFFDSVANFKETTIKMNVLPRLFEYWDFGTKERFFYQMMRLKDDEKSLFYSFLKECKNVDKSQTYMVENNVNGILLDKKKINKKIEFNFVSYNSKIEEINIDESLL